MLRAGSPVDITEVESLVELYERPLFEFKRKANGHAKEEAAGSGDTADTGPVDIEARLAAMAFQGAGTTSVHATQLACTAALLRAGVTVDAVVDEVLAATQRAVADEPQAATWSWPAERWQLERMCFDFINNKHRELVDLLPNSLLAAWRTRQEGGEEHVKVMWSAFIGKWCVTGRKPRVVVD